MKSMRIWLVMALAVALLSAGTCFKKSENGDVDDADNPNFVQDNCPGCVLREEIISNGLVTGFRFYSYVKNIGGTGKVSMTIGAGSGDASKQFDVAAGNRYVFQASVPVENSSSSSFTYMAKFPGTPGYTDSHSVSGYRCTGAPYDLQMNVK